MVDACYHAVVVFHSFRIHLIFRVSPPYSHTFFTPRSIPLTLVISSQVHYRATTGLKTEGTISGIETGPTGQTSAQPQRRRQWQVGATSSKLAMPRTAEYLPEVEPREHLFKNCRSWKAQQAAL